MSPALEAAVQKVIDVISVESEDVHAALASLNAVNQKINNYGAEAQKDAVIDLEGMISARREIRRKSEAKKRLEEAQAKEEIRVKYGPPLPPGLKVAADLPKEG